MEIGKTGIFSRSPPTSIAIFALIDLGHNQLLTDPGRDNDAFVLFPFKVVQVENYPREFG
jgi:hypothetical protein